MASYLSTWLSILAIYILVAVPYINVEFVSLSTINKFLRSIPFKGLQNRFFVPCTVAMIDRLWSMPQNPKHPGTHSWACMSSSGIWKCCWGLITYSGSPRTSQHESVSVASNRVFTHPWGSCEKYCPISCNQIHSYAYNSSWLIYRVSCSYMADADAT